MDALDDMLAAEEVHFARSVGTGMTDNHDPCGIRLKHEKVASPFAAVVRSRQPRFGPTGHFYAIDRDGH